MKTLADLKRHIKAGTELTLIESTKPHKYLNVRRVITRAQSNSYAMKPVEDQSAAECWGDYHKAAQYKFYAEHPNRFTVTPWEGNSMTYEIH